MKYYSDTDKAVWEYLKSIGFKFETVYNGERVEKDNGKWEHDLFTVRLVCGRFELETSYRQGIGHRVSVSRSGLGEEAEQVGAGNPVYLDTVFKGHAMIKTYVKKPSAAAVLHSLMSDADMGENYLLLDFLTDMGYGEDSYKGRQVYEACQKTAGDIRRLFNREQREALAELLADY